MKSKNLNPFPDEVRLPSGRLTEEARTWFYGEVRLRGRNPFKAGEQLGISRSAVRTLLKPISKQWSDGDNLSPKEIAERMYRSSAGAHAKGSDESNLPDVPILAEIPDPITEYDDLNDTAKQAYNELGYWRKRYLGRRHIQWQIEMCLTIMNWMKEARENSERVRGVLNTPPGGGKTTTVTHDFPGWVISRDRNIRIGLGSRTTPQATAYSRRLRNTLERNTLLQVDFGRFKPEQTEVWRQDEFIVDGVTGSEASIEFRLALAGFDYEHPDTRRRLEDPEDSIHEVLEAIESVFVAGEKESTVRALSHEMGFLGGRFDLNLWDDLVDNKNSKTPEQRNELAQWWEDYAVSRAEPGGIVALIGTRFGKYDLFRHCRDMMYTTDEDLEDILLDRITSTMSEDEVEAIREDLMREIYDNSAGAGQSSPDFLTVENLEPDEDGFVQPSRMHHKVYRYVKYPAHNEEKCTSPASLRAKDHIDCILDPVRFKWHDLLRARESNPSRFALTYQQEDESTEDNLIQEVWLTGGTDDEGIIYPGCYDYHRRLLQPPAHLSEDVEGYLPKLDCYSIATVDPSASNYWSIQWWIWHENSDTDYLMNILRARLTSDSFLSYSTKNREYHGVLEQWQTLSKEMDWPIGLWIIEENAAQRYLFQHTWVNEWMQMHRTHIKGHESDPRKADPEYGVQTLRPRYRQGRVNLPYDQDDIRTRAAINEFKKELTEWPDAETDDMVQGHWFLENNRYKIPKGFKVLTHRSQLQHPYQETMTDDFKQRASGERNPHTGTPSNRPNTGHRDARIRRRGERS